MTAVSAPARLMGQLVDLTGQAVGAAFPVRLSVTDVSDGAAASNDENIYVIADRAAIISRMRLLMDGDSVIEMDLVMRSQVQQGDTVGFSPGTLSVTFTGMFASRNIQEVVQASREHDVYVIDEEPSLDD